MPNDIETTPLIYSTADAAPIIDKRLSPRTMERWRQRGTGPRYVKIGRFVGYTRDALEDYVAAQTRRPTAEKKNARRVPAGTGVAKQAESSPPREAA